MSNALICDTCTQVFPEGAEGSVSGNGTFTRTVDGVRKELNRRQDQCPNCADAQNQRWNGARTLEAPKPKTVPPFMADDFDDDDPTPGSEEAEAYNRMVGRPGVRTVK